MKPAVLVFSIALNAYERWFRTCLESQRAYCQRHGFRYEVVSWAPRPLTARESAWLKVLLLHNALKDLDGEGGADGSGGGWTAFIDADCLVRPHAPSFVTAMEAEAGEADICVANGFSGRLNSGVIFCRRTARARDFLGQMLEGADRPVPRADRTQYENGHFIHYAKDNPIIHTMGETWNNNSQIDESSYVQHYSGGDLREWFIANHPQDDLLPEAAKPRPTGLKKVADKVKRRLATTPVLGDRRPKLSVRLGELAPQYLRHYPVFDRG